MPKHITLLRHAKSSWQNARLDDHDRPLNHRGEGDAPRMARRLLAQGARPSLIITSSAARARQTARLFAREINYPIEFIQGEADLYLASPAQILEVIGRQDNQFNDMVVCAHNPGITELANMLCGTSIDNVPTCGMVMLEADAEDWTKLSSDCCSLRYFDFPKNRISS